MSGSASDIAINSIRASVAAVFGSGAHEVGEYLADKVKFHRYRSLMKILAKVRAEYGENAKIPPYKFFVPFCEQASLEEENDDIIIDIWSKLLKDAIREFSSRHMIFLRLIKEITSQEAQLLYDICYNFRGSADPGVWSVADAPGSLAEAAIYNFFVEWTDITCKNAPSSLQRRLIEKFEIPGVVIRDIMFAKGMRGVWPYDRADDDPFADKASPLEARYPRISFDILRGLNLLNEATTNEIWYGDQVIIVSYSELSPLGVEFFSLCNGGTRVTPQRGNYWSPDEGWKWK